MRSLCLYLSFCLLSAGLSAHHLGDPGSSPANAAVLTAHLLEPGQISLGWSSQLVQYPAWSKADLEAHVRSQGHSIFVPEQSWQQSLELGLGAYEWLQLGVSLRSQRLERLREGHVHGDGSFGSHELGNPAGLAGTDLRFKLRLAKGTGYALAFSAGLSLPTGEDNALTDSLSVDATANTTTGKLKSSPKFAYLSPAFQAGSGALSGNVAVAGSVETGLWESSLSLSVEILGAYKTYKAGNSASLGAACGRLFGEEGHERGWIGLELAATQTEPSNLDGVGAEDGGLVVAGGPRLRLPLGARALGVLGASFPLAKPHSMDPAPVGVFSASLQAFF